MDRTKLNLYCYSKCSTCRKAMAWLNSNQIEFQEKDIINFPPTSQLFYEWVFEQGLPLKKFINSTGDKYRELNMKERVKTMTEDEIIAMLASHGKLVKRPILTDGHFVLAGFKEEEWAQALGVL